MDNRLLVINLEDIINKLKCWKVNKLTKKYLSHFTLYNLGTFS